MKGRKKELIKITGVLVLLALFVCACGGGSDGNSSSSKVNTVTGVAAAGAPIFGHVYAKGAEGATTSTDINADGSYDIDVSGLVPPYILYAEGTVNWESVKIYSACLTEDNINITPITDYILRLAIEGDAETAYENWSASSITAEALAAAEASVQQKLQPLLRAAGIPDDINLVCSKFKADHTGLDLVLDSISISYDSTGTIATVTNNLTGSSFTDDVTDYSDDDDAVFPPEDEDSCVDALADAEAINAVWQILVDLYSEEDPTADELNTVWAPYIADDYLNRGTNKTEELDSWVTVNSGPCVGFHVTLTIKRELQPGELVGNINTYERGYLVNTYYSDSCNNSNINTAMVYDGTKWLNFGDRVILGDYGPKDRATMTVHSTGEQNFFTGLGFSVIDSASNYAYSQGARSAIVAGPGLPEGGVILENTYPGQKFNIYDGQESPCGYSGDEWCLTDDLISIIPNNAAYITYLFEEDAATLLVDDDPINNFSSIKYGSTLNNRPLLNSELNSSIFPVLLSPTPPAISNLNIPGDVLIEWETPEEYYVSNVSLKWDEGSSVVTMNFGYLECDAASSHTFDTTGHNSPVGWANIHLSAVNTFGRSVGVSWHFSE